MLLNSRIVVEASASDIMKDNGFDKLLGCNRLPKTRVIVDNACRNPNNLYRIEALIQVAFRVAQPPKSQNSTRGKARRPTCVNGHVSYNVRT